MVFVVVIDGITLGCPCCLVHNCQNPLANNLDRFCPPHQELSQQCAVVGCTETVVEGSQTCRDPLHQEVERVKIAHGQSRFILKERLQHQRVSHPNDSVAVDVSLDDLEDVANVKEDFLVSTNGNVVVGDKNTGNTAQSPPASEDVVMDNGTQASRPQKV